MGTTPRDCCVFLDGHSLRVVLSVVYALFELIILYQRVYAVRGLRGLSGATKVPLWHKREYYWATPRVETVSGEDERVPHPQLTCALQSKADMAFVCQKCKAPLQVCRLKFTARMCLITIDS